MKKIFLAFVAIVSSFIVMLRSNPHVWSGVDSKSQKEIVYVEQISDEDKGIIENMELFENLELFMGENIEMIYLLDIFLAPRSLSEYQALG